MFIKIKNNPEYSNALDSFTIIDNVDVINYFRPSPFILMNLDDVITLYDNLHAYDGIVADTDWLDGVKKSTSDPLPTSDTPYKYNVINFRRKDTPDDDDIMWMFDTIAYIMSDDGKTIEKVHAGGIHKSLV